MNLTCRDCHSDFSLPPETIGTKNLISSACPYCGARFEVVRGDPSTPPTVIFESEKKGKRICINCSKEFESDSQEPIPICPNCRDAKKKTESLKQTRRWKWLRDGREMELESESSVRDLIFQHALSPSDRLTNPEGRFGPAMTFPEFRPIFYSQRKKIPSQALTGILSRLRRRIRHTQTLGIWSLLALAALALGWAGYRITTFRLPPHEKDPVFKHFLAELQHERGTVQRLPGALLETARKLMARDQIGQYLEAREALELELLSGEPTAESLSLLAETYAILSRLKTYRSLQNTAKDVAELTLRLYPKEVDGHFALACVLLRNQDHVHAMEEIQKTLNQSPTHLRAQLLRARIHMETAETHQDLLSAATDAANVIRSAPTLLEAYDLLGVAYERLGKPAYALKTFEARLARSSEDSLVLFRMGHLEEKANNFQNASEWYQQSLRTDPALVTARFHLARICHRVNGRYDLAERHLRNILTRYQDFADPRDIFQAQTELIEVLLRTDRSGEAADLSKRLRMEHGDVRIMALIRARVASSSGQYNEAITALQQFTSQHPQDPRSHLLLARIVEKTKDVEKTRKIYRSAIELQPRALPPYLRLAKIFGGAGRYNEAADLAASAIARGGFRNPGEYGAEFFTEEEPVPWAEFERAFQTLAKARPNRAATHGLLGLTRLRRGLQTNNQKLFPKAVAVLRKAVRLERDSEHLAVHLGRAQFAQKKWKDARTAFRSALTINPSSAAAHYWLGRTHLKTKSWAEAEAPLKTVLPDRIWGYRAAHEMGILNYARGNTTEAVKFWTEALAREPRYVPPWRALLLHAAEFNIDILLPFISKPENTKEDIKLRPETPTSTSDGS